MMLREEYEAHDVAGLLKEYFRKLPDPLMTEDAYAHFITASTLGLLVEGAWDVENANLDVKRRTSLILCLQGINKSDHFMDDSCSSCSLYNFKADNTKLLALKLRKLTWKECITFVVCIVTQRQIDISSIISKNFPLNDL